VEFGNARYQDVSIGSCAATPYNPSIESCAYSFGSLVPAPLSLYRSAARWHSWYSFLVVIKFQLS
jgi:hypothetical protein